jgi:hypothetical protein
LILLRGAAWDTAHIIVPLVVEVVVVVVVVVLVAGVAMLSTVAAAVVVIKVLGLYSNAASAADSGGAGGGGGVDVDVAHIVPASAILVSSAEGGHVDCLHYAHTHGYPIDDRIAVGPVVGCLRPWKKVIKKLVQYQ